MQKKDSIFISGHKGLVGSAIFKYLKNAGYQNIITQNKDELNLLDQNSTYKFFEKNKINFVIHAAAKVGGILFNKNNQADMLYENMTINNNVIKASADNGVEKLLYFGSSCIYPKYSEQPINEEYLLTGNIEPTNEGYGLAKIVGLKLCEKLNEQYNKNFITMVPANLYGPGDNFHPENSHVIPSLLRRFHDAKLNSKDNVEIWGSGNAIREFLYIEDLAKAAVYMLNNYNEKTHLNIGSGEVISIKELSFLIKEIVQFKGNILFDTTKPDGMLKKELDISKMKNYKWRAKIGLNEGLKRTYEYALKNKEFSS